MAALRLLGAFVLLRKTAVVVDLVPSRVGLNVSVTCQFFVFLLVLIFGNIALPCAAGRKTFREIYSAVPNLRLWIKRRI